MPNGIPSHDTFNRVCKFLDAKAFGECLYRWSGEFLASLQHHQVAIDRDACRGKVLRASARSGHKKSGICVVSAWVSDHRLVLGQQRVEGKSNEKQAIPELLDSLDLTGAIVTIDAVACQVSVARQIRAKQAHYLLALKQNQRRASPKHLYQQVWSQLLARQAQLPRQSELQTGGGRFEKRTAYVLEDLTWVEPLADWPGVKSVVRSWLRVAKNGIITQENRLCLTSLEANPLFILELTRGHWGIENKLHWQLDVAFREDQQRVRVGNGADNMAPLRKLALQVLHQAQHQESIKTRRKMAAWSNPYLVRLLTKLRF